MLKKLKGIIANNFLTIYIIYYLTLSIDATSLAIDYPFLVTIAKIVRYLTYVLFFIRIIYLLPEYKKIITEKKWKDKDKNIKLMYILTLIIFIALMVNLVITKNKKLLFLMMILVSSYNTDYKKIMKTTKFMQIVLTSLFVTLSIFGVTQNYILDRGEIQRSSLGFMFTNFLSEMVLFSSILYLYEVGFKAEWISLAGIQVLNAFAYFITNSRTEFIIIEFTLVVMVICKIWIRLDMADIIDKLKKVFSKFFICTFAFYPILSFIMVLCYKYGGIWNKINSILSNRLRQTYDNFLIYGIKPFGQKIEFLGLGLKERVKYGYNYKSNFVDNEYLQLMLSEGVIFTICLIAVFIVLLKMLYTRKKYKEIILCSIYLMFGLLNPRILNVLYCPITFMIIPTILEYREQKRNEENGEKNNN